MHENLDLILTLAGAFTAALILGYATQRIGLSPIVGYLLAGVVVGPNTPGFVADTKLANELAEVGVILLMFGVGLHFHVKDLLAVRRIAVPGAIGQILVTTLVAGAVGIAFGGSVSAGLVFGLAISVASTVVLLRVLSDHNDLHTPSGHIAVGWLVVEDLVTVVVLVMLPVVFRAEAQGFVRIILSLSVSILKIGLLVAAILYVGRRLIPWLLARMAATRSRELFTLTILVVPLGIAAAAAKLFGASMALGAFLAGMVVGQSDFSLRAASEAIPLRDAFAVLFFVSVGMLFQPAFLLESPGFVAATLSLVILLKPLVALAIVLALGYPLRAALAVGVALGQIGEFSFILAEVARGLGIVDESATNTFVVAALVSISLNPLLYGLLDRIEVQAKGRPALAKWLRGRKAGGHHAFQRGPCPYQRRLASNCDGVPSRNYWLWTGRSHRREAVAGELGGTDDRRTQSRNGSAPPRRRDSSRLWRRAPRGVVERGRHRARNRAGAERGQPAREPGNDSTGPRIEPGNSRVRADELPPRSRRFEESGGRRDLH
jgi:CPA2 family monovalent cation:H+ antiporter-2